MVMPRTNISKEITATVKSAYSQKIKVFMLMSRCGVDTEAVFEREDFAEIINFNTPATINALGIATSDISEMALREISQTIRDVQIAEKSQNRTFAPQSQTRYDVGRQQAERSNHNERNHIHQTRGLSYSRPNITDRARNSAWQMWWSQKRQLDFDCKSSGEGGYLWLI